MGDSISDLLWQFADAKTPTFFRTLEFRPKLHPNEKIIEPVAFLIYL